MRALATLWLVLLVPVPAAAHGVRPGVLSLAETAPHRWSLAWTEPEDSRRATPSSTTLRFPDGCVRVGTTLTCEGELAGALWFEDLPDPRTRIVVSIARLDGSSRELVVTGESTEAGIAARLDLDAPPGSSLTAWIALGIEHVLGGLDHLAFVIGLLLVCGIERRLVLSVTAFTLAHSLTLALSALDVFTLPSAPVEASIAASVVLVARESIQDRRTLTRRMPWLVAALFGLVHGLGFAGALAEIGLPRGATTIALVGFNLGVELGQLAVIGAATAIVLATRRRAPAGSKRIVATAIGALGALWMIERVLAMIATS